MEIKLTKSQQRGYDEYKKGKNLFIHGDSGTGKSSLVKVIFNEAVGDGKTVFVMAPTGKAAKNINGMTIHSVFRMKPGIIDKETIYKGKVNRDTNIPDIDHCNLMIIDEISMVRFDTFCAVMRSIEASNCRSGKAMQVIVVGDFYQIPPVLNEDKEGEAYHKLHGTALYAFESDAFKKFTPIHLTEVVRQQGDKRFLEILNKLRVGDSSVLPCLPVRPANPNAITLCATNKQADSINDRMLKQLYHNNKPKEYCGNVSGKVTEDDKFAPDRLTLVKGAHVLMTVNDPEKRWMNGTDAIVVACNEDSVVLSIAGTEARCEPVKQDVTVPEVTTDNDGKIHVTQKVVGTYTQLPIKLGWAISIHKSQGMTLEDVNIDPSGCFEHGQLYVAVSRCKSLEGLRMITEPKPEHLICSQVVKDYMNSLDSNTPTCDPPAEVLVPPEEPHDDTVQPENTQQQDVVDDEGTIDEDSFPKARLSLADIKYCASLYLWELLAEYGYSSDSLYLEYKEPKSSDEAVEKRERWKKAKEQRNERLPKNIEAVDNPEARKRLVISTDNSQAVYGLLREKASESGIAEITVDAIANSIGLSPRSVGTALNELREVGLIRSAGSKKRPEIILLSDFDGTNSEGHCLLFKSIKTEKEKHKMQLACSLCPSTACYSHPANNPIKTLSV